MATFPPDRRSPMIPEPITVASRKAVPRNSAPRRFRSGESIAVPRLNHVRPISRSLSCKEILSSERKGRLIKMLMRWLSMRIVSANARRRCGFGTLDQ